MKSILFMLLLSAGLQVCIAQSPTLTFQDTINTTPQRWRDTCFGLLDLSSSQIPSGFLLDYSMLPFNDSSYNSLLTSSVDTISESGSFLSVLSILKSSAVNANAATLIATDSMFINAYRLHRNTGYFPLLFLYQAYQRINPTALSSNLFTLSADSLRIMDVPGRSSSPYKTGYCFAFSPFQEKITQFGPLTFTAPSNLWQMPGVSSVSVDFGDGTGFHSMSANSTVSITYTTSGIKVLTAQVTTSAGTFSARSSIEFQLPLSYRTVDTSFAVTVSPVYLSKTDYVNAHSGHRNINARRSPSALDLTDACSDGSLINKGNCDINPGAHIEIENGCDHVFDKPIILVEGFDPLNEVDAEDLKFVINTTGVGQSFLSTMREQGYDIVYVLFTNTTDFIENNAAVLEEVIQRVNTLKTGTNKNTVIGLSMGGLVARWALRDMENKSIDHQTLNYFSYDSPHQGANVPLGLQALYLSIAADFPQLKTRKDFTQVGAGFISKAADEMLVLNANSTNGTAVTDIRAAFAKDLIDMGYPQTTVNYGISLGRGNNSSGTTDAGTGAQFGNFVPGSNIFHGALTFLIQNMSADAFAGPNNTTGQVLHYVYSGFSPIRIFGLTIGSTYSGHVRNVFLSSAPSYDDVPGGYDNVQARFVNAWTPKARGYAGPASLNGHYGHTFIPLVSALDLTNQGYGVSGSYFSNNMYYALDNNIQNPAQVSGNTLSPSSLSPFHAVLTYTSDCGSVSCQFDNTSDKLRSLGGLTSPLFTNVNQYHEAALSNQAQLFVQRSILGTNTFTSCAGSTDFCSSSIIGIQGSTSVCSANEQYTLATTGGLDNVSIQWTFPNGLLQLVSGAGTPTITVKRTGTSNGTEIITAILTNSCGQTSNYTLNVGVKSIPDYSRLSIVSQGPSVCAGVNVGFGARYDGNCTNLLAAGITNVTWTVSPSPTSITNNAGTSGCGASANNSGVQIKFGSASTNYNVSINATNVCGTSFQSDAYVVTTKSAIMCGGGPHFTVAPNPSSGNLVVTATSEQDETANQTARIANAEKSTDNRIFEIKISNAQGVIKKSYKYSTGVKSVNLDLTSLPSGTYFIQSFDNIKWESQQFVIIK
jgi:hypothetical protein